MTTHQVRGLRPAHHVLKDALWAWQFVTPRSAIVNLMVAFPTLPLRDAIDILDGDARYTINENTLETP